MNYSSLGLAALGGTVASFAFGFLVFWLVPGLINEARKYPAVFRPKEEMKTVMPIGFVATFMAILVAAIIFAMIHQGGSGTTEGARFGRSHWHFRGLRIGAAQLREPEHRAEARSGTGCGLLRPVDYHRNSHRSYLQTPRYTIIVNISVAHEASTCSSLVIPSVNSFSGVIRLTTR